MKTKVMLHYTQFGTQRSPNDQFDILRSQKALSDRYEFITLNQDPLASEIGNIQSIKRLVKQIKMVKPEIIHICGIKEGIHCVIAAFICGVKKRIVVTHGFSGLTPSKRTFRKFFIRWIVEPLVLLLATDVQCNSLFSMHQQMVRLFAKRKSVMIYNYLSITPTNPDYFWRNSNHIGANFFIISTMGYIKKGKGYDTLVNIIGHFNGASDVCFVILGDGEYKEEFESKVAKQIKSGQVRVFGMVPHQEAMQIVSESDLFCLPTRFESFGMVFAEAGSYCVPSIAGKVGAVPEIIEDGVTGYLLNPEDVDGAVEKIEYLMSHRKARAQMGTAAKKRVGMLFSDEATTEGIIKLYASDTSKKEKI